jgi:hypothetical protein
MNVITTNITFTALQCNEGFVKCTLCLWIIEYADDFTWQAQFELRKYRKQS